jgi:hypothetical protein
MLIYFIAVVANDNLNNQVDESKRAEVEGILERFFKGAEILGIVVVVMAGDAPGDQVGTVILMRLSALYELTI